MNKTRLVFRNEFITTITRKSFLFSAFGLPLIVSLILLGVQSLNKNSPNTLSAIVGDPNSTDCKAVGYVDYSGLIKTLPDDIPPDVLFAFHDEGSANRAVENGDIAGYYIIPEEYVQVGEITFMMSDFNPISADGDSWRIQWVLLYNLLGGDITHASKVWKPMDLQVTVLLPDEQVDLDSPLTFYVPYITTIVFYITIFMAASLLLNSIAGEKQNQVIEILLLSVKPVQLLIGKIIALGIAGLIQTIAWVGTGSSLPTYNCHLQS
jgi:ABC-2 type transport system permease protein